MVGNSAWQDTCATLRVTVLRSAAVGCSNNGGSAAQRDPSVPESSLATVSTRDRPAVGAHVPPPPPPKLPSRSGTPLHDTQPQRRIAEEHELHTLKEDAGWIPTVRRSQCVLRSSVSSGGGVWKPGLPSEKNRLSIDHWSASASAMLFTRSRASTHPPTTNTAARSSPACLPASTPVSYAVDLAAIRCTSASLCSSRSQRGRGGQVVWGGQTSASLTPPPWLLFVCLTVLT